MGCWARSRDLYLPGHFIASQPRTDRVHITQKPVEIMQKLVQICPEDGVVLGPFTGSGSTGVAALREGWRFAGVEVMVGVSETEAFWAELTVYQTLPAG